MEQVNRTEISEQEKLRAAYALNLCTVSVSQIIDYDDEYILEQEYEAILNNLNLERMPKDEALLRILQELLNTITFFRIQEGEKQLIEKEYQHKMKNAIWNSAPNFGMLIATKNPWVIATTLVVEIGIGYMNYRKTKAENNLDKERKKWQLQRSAMEQFNGLRRELFDTAWRLAAEYSFPDKYRLTERQIKQYNQILMDTDDMRRFERLDSIKDNFLAYPPFWYFLGNAANLVAQKEKEYNPSMYEEYIEKAKECFERYLQESKENLLREDTLVSSCALEYIEILDVTTEKEKIHSLLKTAIVSSGNANDILEICAMTYLRLGERQEAADLLLKLVNEDYNTIVNAQLLSNIYVYEYILADKEDVKAQMRFRYDVLGRRLSEAQYLFPFPSSAESDVEYTQEKFLAEQKEILKNKYKQVIVEFTKKEIAAFNKLIPMPDESKVPMEVYHLEGSKKQRQKELEILFANDNSRRNYISKLQDVNFMLSILEILNEIMRGWSELDCISLDDETIISGCITHNILSKKKFYGKFQDKVTLGTVTYADMQDLFREHDLMGFIKEGVNEVYTCFSEYISEIQNMSDLNIAEESLWRFCREKGLSDPMELYANLNRKQSIALRDKIFFSTNLLGNAAVQKQKNTVRTKEMIKHIQESKDKIILDKEHVELFVKGELGFNRYIEKLKSGYDREHLLAIIDDKKFGGVLGKDLWFYTTGISLEKSKSITKYNSISMGSGTLLIGGKTYENKDLDIEKLYQITQRLAEYAKQIEMEKLGTVWNRETLF